MNFRLMSSMALALLVVQLSTGCRPHLQSNADLQPVILHHPTRLAGSESLALWRWTYTRGTSKGQIWQILVEPARSEVSVESAGKTARSLARIFSDAMTAGQDAAAINGGFYDAKGALGLVVSHGDTVHRFRKNGGSGVLVLRDAALEIVHRDSFDQTAEVDHALQSIDRLVEGGRNLVVSKKLRPKLAARSAVALDAHGRLSMFVAFDDQAIVQEREGIVYLGSDVVEHGLTLFEFADLLARPRKMGGLGQLSALNLDGGPSTALEARFASRRFAVVGYHGTINAIAARRVQAEPSAAGSP